MAIFSKSREISKNINDNTSSKIYWLSKLSAFVLALLLVLPVMLIDLNLLTLYYDLRPILIVILALSFVAIVEIYTKFYLDLFYHHEIIKDKKDFKYVLLTNLIYSLIVCFVLFLFLFVVTR